MVFLKIKYNYIYKKSKELIINEYQKAYLLTYNKNLFTHNKNNKIDYFHLFFQI